MNRHGFQSISALRVKTQSEKFNPSCLPVADERLPIDYKRRHEFPEGTAHL